MSAAAVLIDPAGKEVKLVQVSNSLDLQEMYRLLDCDLVDLVALPLELGKESERKGVVYGVFDEEGLLKGGPAFALAGMPRISQCFAGKALLVASNDRLASLMDVWFDADDVNEAVTFLEERRCFR